MESFKDYPLLETMTIYEISMLWNEKTPRRNYHAQLSKTKPVNFLYYCDLIIEAILKKSISEKDVNIEKIPNINLDSKYLEVYSDSLPYEVIFDRIKMEKTKYPYFRKRNIDIYRTTVSKMSIIDYCIENNHKPKFLASEIEKSSEYNKERILNQFVQDAGAEISVLYQQIDLQTEVINTFCDWQAKVIAYFENNKGKFRILKKEYLEDRYIYTLSVGHEPRSFFSKLLKKCAMGDPDVCAFEKAGTKLFNRYQNIKK